MNRWLLCFAGAFTLTPLLLQGCSGLAEDTTQRQHPDLNNRTASYTTVAILPTSASLYGKEPYVGRIPASSDPEAEDPKLLEELAAYRNSRLGEQSDRIARDLNQLLADDFAHRGYAVLRLDANEVSDGETDRIIKRLSQDLYGQGTVDPIAAKQYRYSLGTELAPLNDNIQAELLVFAGFWGWRRSAAEATAEYLYHLIFVIPLDTASGAGKLMVSVIDSKTGDLLWANEVEHSTFNPNPPDYEMKQLRKMLTQALSPLKLTRVQSDSL